MQFNLITIGTLPAPEKLRQFHPNLRITHFKDLSNFLANRARLRTVHGFLLASDANPLIVSDIRKSYPSSVVLVVCEVEETQRAELALQSGANDVLFSDPDQTQNLKRIFVRLLQVKGDGLKLAYSDTRDIHTDNLVSPQTPEVPLDDSTLQVPV